MVPRKGDRESLRERSPHPRISSVGHRGGHSVVLVLSVCSASSSGHESVPSQATSRPYPRRTLRMARDEDTEW